MSSRVARCGFVLVLALLFAVASAGCDSSEIDRLESAEGISSDPTVVRIGFAGPLTGRDGARGRSMLRSVELAVREANADARVQEARYEFAVSAQDDQNDLESAYEAVNTLRADETVVAVIGHPDSDATLFAASVYEESRLPLINLSTSPLVTALGFDLINRIMPREDSQGSFAAEIALEELELRSSVVIDDGTSHGTGVADAFIEEFVRGGGSVLAHLHGDPEDLDPDVMAEEVGRFESDFVFWSGGIDEAVRVSKSLHARVPDTPLFAKSGCCTSEYLETVGEAGEGDVAVRLSVPVEQQPRGKDFATYYSNAFGAEALPLDPYAYDAAWVVIRSVLLEGADRESVARAIRTGEFEGVTGPIEFDENGDSLNQSMAAYRVVDGEWVQVR